MDPWIIYGTAWKKERTEPLVRLALTQGFRAIDTANQPKHYNEPAVGAAVAGSSIPRAELFLQTKFTPEDGHDERIPYDSNAPLAEQVRQSFESSLEHLRTDYVDSYLLHGPYNHPGLGEEDWEVWRAMEAIHRSGRAKRIGISNVNPQQLEELVKGAEVKPLVVQNRCFASRSWDDPVRAVCRRHGIAYQGFSLLTANPQVLAHEKIRDAAGKLGVTPEQLVFRNSLRLGMVLLTGTTDPDHMTQDLAVRNLPEPPVSF